DFSCAIFNSQGEMVAQAAHIPVHLGAMPLSVQEGIRSLSFEPGDVVILNDPYKGGTHLPDITLITPIFHENELIGFSANRAHHSDVGGIAPGSMPLSSELFQEGIIIPPVKLLKRGQLNKDIYDFIMVNVRTPLERAGDLNAQIAANQKGLQRILDLVARYGMNEVLNYMQELLDYAELMMRNLLETLPDGSYKFTDYMDNDGIKDEPIKISVEVKINGSEAKIDFAGSSPQVEGGINAVYAITLSAVYYVFRSLVGLDIPSNSGCLRPIKIIVPENSIVNASHPAAVAGGNVETSQRITDVLLGALAKACPDRVPAASQGTMNNLSIGGWDPIRKQNYAYYETIGGGMGAEPDNHGEDAIHSHMTNTLNTPIEALEYAYPFTVKRYEIRQDSGGQGKFHGGNGIRRDIELSHDAKITILSDRRKFPPYGLAGGESGKRGQNLLIRDNAEKELAGKVTFNAKEGDIISIRSPGGGGFGV
ncbi:hydantoinase B/oxoprolinase family protein, partial [bacterium]|nr:hydantoinase B/oxoprolinase family protein [bacterium]